MKDTFFGEYRGAVSEKGRFFGKYRGTVTNNSDPDGLGQIRAKVPDVFGAERESGWAMPCAPFGGSGRGFFALPAIGAGVWIEFEHGDSEKPIWVGCWFGSKEDLPPDILDAPDKKVMIKTSGGQTIILDDTNDGSITLQTSGGQKIVLSAASIEIDNGKGGSIKLDGSKVSINRDGLEVE
jgi:uncharacterized protein involved in type VI secretion and phage assembly